MGAVGDDDGGIEAEQFLGGRLESVGEITGELASVILDEVGVVVNVICEQKTKVRGEVGKGGLVVEGLGFAVHVVLDGVGMVRVYGAGVSVRA